MHGKGALTGGATDIAYQLLTKGKVDLKEVTFSTVTGAIVTPGVAKVTTFAIDNWGTVVNSNEINAIKNIDENKKHHIIEGSKGHDHKWHEVVPDKNWNDIEKIIIKTMKEGTKISNQDYGESKILNINGKKVQVKYVTLPNGNISISNAWIKK